MAFLNFRVGNNNYELRDVTECHVLNGEYYESLTEKSKVFDLVLKKEPADYIVGQIYGEVCEINSISKMIFVESVMGFSTATDQVAMVYALEYLNNREL